MLLIVNPDTPKEMLTTLKGLGHHVSFSLSFPSGILSHPDQQIHMLNDTTAITAPAYYSYYRKLLPKHISLLCGDKNPTGTYPEDCAYNVARINTYVFCNTNAAEPKILAYYTNSGYHICHVNQGYAKCNMTILGNDCILTEDKGIHNFIIANKLKIHSVLLPVGEISLSGFPYGFIGGSGGGMGDFYFWYGDIRRCSYYEIIKEQTEERGIENISLATEPLCDFGGIICVPL